MALSLDKSSATLSADKAGAKTAVEPGNDFALLHCTRNVRVGDVNAPGQPDPTNGPAIQLKGKVLIAGDPVADKLASTSWKAAIVQVANVLVYEMKYAGRMANEGSMVANIRNGFNPNPCFDAKTLKLDDAFNNSATTVTPVFGAKPGFLFTVVANDSPFSFVRLKFENALVRAPNFLHSVRRDEGFVSYLVVKDPAGTVTFVSHIGWHIIWHAELQWKTPEAKPTVVMKTSSFEAGQPVLGEPTPADASLAMAKNPTGATANELDRAAFKAGFVDRNTSILTQSQTRAGDLPGVFF